MLLGLLRVGSVVQGLSERLIRVVRMLVGVALIYLARDLRQIYSRTAVIFCL